VLDHQLEEFIAQLEVVLGVQNFVDVCRHGSIAPREKNDGRQESD
jgi:hypothetical protein